MAAETFPWRRVASVAGLSRAPDLPFLLWPSLWAAWMAGGGAPDPWRLAALLMAVLLARSAAWSGFLPEASRLGDIWGERRFLILFFGAGACCFALPLGAPGALVPLALAPVALWYQTRRRSYLSDPLLALALMLLPLAGWLTQTGAPTASAGLLLLATALWSLAALVAAPVQRNTASLALLAAPHPRAGAAALRVTALVALWLAGRHAHLGHGLLAGLGVALALEPARWRLAGRLPPWAWEAGWGGAVLLGVAGGFPAEGP